MYDTSCQLKVALTQFYKTAHRLNLIKSIEIVYEKYRSKKYNSVTLRLGPSSENFFFVGQYFQNWPKKYRAKLNSFVYDAGQPDAGL